MFLFIWEKRTANLTQVSFMCLWFRVRVGINPSHHQSSVIGMTSLGIFYYSRFQVYSS